MRALSFKSAAFYVGIAALVSIVLGGLLLVLFHRRGQLDLVIVRWALAFSSAFWLAVLANFGAGALAAKAGRAAYPFMAARAAMTVLFIGLGLGCLFLPLVQDRLATLFEFDGLLGFASRGLGYALGGTLAAFAARDWAVAYVGGLLILVSMPIAMRIVAQAAGRLDRWSAGKFWGGADEEDAKREGWFGTNRLSRWLRNDGLRRFFFLSTLFFGVAIVLSPIVIAILSSKSLLDERTVRDLAKLVWIGPYAVMLDFAVASLELASRDQAQSATAEQASPASQRAPRIGELRKRLKALSRDAFLFEYVRAGAPVGPSQDGGRSNAAGEPDFVRHVIGKLKTLDQSIANRAELSDIVLRLADPTRERRNGGGAFFYIEESLSEIHFAFFREIALARSDAGETTLVVCPDLFAEETLRGLREAEDVARSAEVFLTVWDGREGNILGDTPYAVVVLPESRFETGFIRHATAEYKAILDRLGLIVLLEASNMDLARLRLRLSLLGLHSALDGARFILQTAVERSGAFYAKAIVEGLNVEPEQISIEPTQPRDLATLVLKASPELRRRLAEGVPTEQRVSMSSYQALAAISAEFDADAVVYEGAGFDPELAFAKGAWSATNAEIARDGISQAVLNTLGRSPFSRYIGRASTAVVIVHDRANLLAIRNFARPTRTGKAAMVVITADPYPMLGFFRENYSKGRDDGFQDLLPQAPRLDGGGLSELAYLVLDALALDRGVAEGELVRLFRRAVDPRFLKAAGIGPDAGGIRRLIAMRFAATTPPIDESEDKVTGEPRYTLRRNTARVRELALNLVAPAKITIRDRRDETVLIDDSDWGLRFYEGTLLMIGRSTVTIKSFEEMAREITVATTNLVPPPSYAFVSTYHFLGEPESRIIEHVGAVQEHGGAWQGRSVAAFAHLSYEREAIGHYSWPHGELPFDLERRPRYERRVGTAQRHERRFRATGHLVVAYQHADALEPPAGTAQAAPGGEAGKGDLRDERLARVALAVATLLKDTITSLYPDQAHRIAVLSPQARPLHDRLISETGETPLSPLDQFLIRRIPRGYFAEGREPGTWWPVQNALPAEFERLDILIVEDAQWEIGIARELIENRSNSTVLKAAERFLDWLLSTAGTAQTNLDGHYPRFGYHQDSKVLDLHGARTVLRMLRGEVADAPSPIEA